MSLSFFGAIAKVIALQSMLELRKSLKIKGDGSAIIPAHISR
jgi:hypothetical protein